MKVLKISLVISGAIFFLALFYPAETAADHSTTWKREVSESGIISYTLKMPGRQCQTLHSEEVLAYKVKVRRKVLWNSPLESSTGEGKEAFSHYCGEKLPLHPNCAWLQSISRWQTTCLSQKS